MKMQPLTEDERLAIIQRDLKSAVNGRNWIVLPCGFSLFAEGFSEGNMRFRGVQLIKPTFLGRLLNWLRGKPMIYTATYHFTVNPCDDEQHV